MAVPFRRTSKSKKAMRRSHSALKITGVVTCSNCGELTLAHRICQNCGYYKNKPVIEIKEKNKEE